MTPGDVGTKPGARLDDVITADRASNVAPSLVDADFPYMTLWWISEKINTKSKIKRQEAIKSQRPVL